MELKNDWPEEIEIQSSLDKIHMEDIQKTKRSKIWVTILDIVGALADIASTWFH